MPVNSRNQLQKLIKERKYLNKDFDGFRSDLEEYAKTYFPDKVKDFSTNGVAGMFIELAAYIGDVQSYYLDHLFQELSPQTAVEPKNIESLLEDSNVKIIGASPAVVDITFYIRVPSEEYQTGLFRPRADSLPILNAGTVVQAKNGTYFELFENLDFNETNSDGTLKATYSVGTGDRDALNNPTHFILSREKLCISGQRNIETISVNGFEKFKTFTLSRNDVTNIISVKDENQNTYYEVEFLTQDTVFRGIINKNEDNELVEENLEIIPAPYRFYSKMSLQTRLTTLYFGGGNAESLNDDIIPDPSEYAVPLYGKKNFSSFSINPSNLLNTSTLGVISPNTTITVEYRYGGGLSHNIEPDKISGVTTLRIQFPKNPPNNIAAAIASSIDAVNLKEAKGGLDAPTLDELKLMIPNAKMSQSRIVTKEDLLARIYTMPSNFGRVFRACVRSNPINPIATRLFIICKNINNELVTAPDSLKKNLSKYLNNYRLITDAIDILDAQVINLQINYKIIAALDQNKQLVLQNVNYKLIEYFNVKNFEIDQPLSLPDITNIIYNTPGVLSVDLNSLNIVGISGTVGSKVYSDINFNVSANTYKGGLVIPPPGGIFEIKYKNLDIKGTVE